MLKNTIDIKAGRLFPFHFLILGGIFLFAALVVVVSHPIIAGILALLGLFIITAYEGTEIDPHSKTYREYHSFLFLKSGKRVNFNSVEGVFIHKAKVSQKLFTAHTMNSSTFTHVEYHAYLKLDHEKIFLTRGKDKKKVVEKARSIASSLNASVFDYAVVP